MKKILIIGGGAMGSAFSVPCLENNNSVTITEPLSPLSADPTAKTDVTCFGFDDGTATVVNPSGGTPFSTGNPYTYLWSPGGQNTQTATGLIPGIYTCTVTDANGCTFTTTSVTITEPVQLIADSIFISSLGFFGIGRDKWSRKLMQVVTLLLRRRRQGRRRGEG